VTGLVVTGLVVTDVVVAGASVVTEAVVGRAVVDGPAVGRSGHGSAVVAAGVYSPTTAEIAVAAASNTLNFILP